MKKFIDGGWKMVRADGSVAGPCDPPTDAERAEMKAAESAAAAAPKYLKAPLAFGSLCPLCGEKQKLMHPSSNRCPSCKAVYEVKAKPPPKPGSLQYKVITQRDEFFKSSFNPEALQEMLNEHAEEGWRVVSMTATDVGSFMGSFWGKGGGSSRQELVILLERKVPGATVEVTP